MRLPNDGVTVAAANDAVHMQYDLPPPILDFIVSMIIFVLRQCCSLAGRNSAWPMPSGSTDLPTDRRSKLVVGICHVETHIVPIIDGDCEPGHISHT